MTTLHKLLPLLVVVAVACDAGPGGQVGDLCTKAGNVCSTPACSQFPTTPGCSAVKPNGSYCPVDLYRCWDPTTSSSYCNPMTSRCAKAKTPPGTCTPPLCTLATFQACYDTNDEIFCKNGYNCTSFACTSDGGVSDGGMGDATILLDLFVQPDASGEDQTMSMPMDMSLPTG